MHWIYAHLIGDYLLQNDWMALNKKAKTWNCLVHIAAYMIPFMFCGMSLVQLVLIAIQHFAIDRTNFVVWFMRVKGQSKFMGPPCGPWSIIVVDNILHILWIAAVVHFVA